MGRMGTQRGQQLWTNVAMWLWEPIVANLLNQQKLEIQICETSRLNNLAHIFINIV